MCYMVTNGFIVYIKTDDIYKDIAKYVEKRFDTYGYELERLLSKENDKKSHWPNQRQITWKSHKFFWLMG